MRESIGHLSGTEGAHGPPGGSLSRLLSLGSHTFRGWGLWAHGARTAEEAERHMASHAVGLLEPAPDHAVADLSRSSRIGLGDESVDRILAVDRACEHDSRASFFREAHRVLRPGGRLVITELCGGMRSLNPVYALMKRAVVRHWRLPDEGLYDADDYEARLEDAGFPGASVRSIADQVFPGAFSFFLSDDHRRRLREACGAVQEWTFAQTMSWMRTLYVQGHIDYVQVVARKPQDAGRAFQRS